MTGSSVVQESLQSSVAVMNMNQLALAYAALGCYVLLLGGGYGPKSRNVCAALAFVSVAAFVCMSSPWENGVILVALGIAAIGAFVAAVWVMSAAFGLRSIAHDERQPAALTVQDSAVCVTEPAAPRGHAPVPVRTA